MLAEEKGANSVDVTQTSSAAFLALRNIYKPPTPPLESSLDGFPKKATSAASRRLSASHVAKIAEIVQL